MLFETAISRPKYPALTDYGHAGCVQQVFYPLLVDDLKISEESGAAHFWLVGRKKGALTTKAMQLEYVCPLCNERFVDGSYHCASCGRTFSAIDGVPNFLVYNRSGS